MEVIKVNKPNLMKAIKENRDLHRKMASEAREGYRQKVIEWFEKTLEKIRNEGPVPRSVPFDLPEDHTKDYDRVLGMLTMSMDDRIELTEGEFARYVMDDWTWKAAFIEISKAYGYTGPTGPTGSSGMIGV